MTGQISIESCNCLGTLSYSSGSDREGRKNDTCIACPEGAICHGQDGMLLEALGTKKGWWRSSNISNKWHECYKVNRKEVGEEEDGKKEKRKETEKVKDEEDPNVINTTVHDYDGDCVGQNPSTHNGNGTSSCFRGHTGPLCMVCVSGRQRIHGPGTPCMPCIKNKPNNGGAELEQMVQHSVITLCVLTSIVFFAATTVYLSYPEKTKDNEKDQQEGKEENGKNNNDGINIKRTLSRASTTRRISNSAIRTTKKTVAEAAEEKVTENAEEAAGGTFDGMLEEDAEKQNEELKRTSIVIQSTESFVANAMDSAEELLHDISGAVVRQGKILVGWIQIMSGLVSVFSIPWPSSFRSFLNLPLWSLFNIDISEIFGIINPCLFNFPFATRFAIHVALLPVALLLAWLASWFVRGLRVAFPSRCGHRFTVATAKAKVLKMMVVLVFFLYPGLTIKIFTVWKCVEIDKGQFYMAENMSVRCFSSEQWVGLAIASVFAMLVFVIGIPVGTFVILRRMRNMQLKGRKRKKEDPTYVDIETDSQMQSFGSLIEGYEDEFWWWEVVEMFKKMALTGGLVLIAPGSSSQILLGCLISLFYILAFVRFLPCAEIDNDQTQFISSLQILLTLLAGFALKTESEDSGLYESWLMDILLNFMAIVVLVTTILAMMSDTLPKVASVGKCFMMVLMCRCHDAKLLVAETMEKAAKGEADKEDPASTSKSTAASNEKDTQQRVQDQQRAKKDTLNSTKVAPRRPAPAPPPGPPPAIVP